MSRHAGALVWTWLILMVAVVVVQLQSRAWWSALLALSAAAAGAVVVYAIATPAGGEAPLEPVAKNEAPTTNGTHTSDVGRANVSAPDSSDLAGEQAAGERIRSILEAVPDAVVATDRSGLILHANSAARTLFSALASVESNRPIDEVFTQAEVLVLHAKAMEGHAGKTQLRIGTESGTRTFEVIASPVALKPRASSMEPSGGAVLLFRDITELALASQLKTDFVANASHELRTPLSAIRLAVETIREAGREDPQLLDRLSAVLLSNTARLEELVNDLLDLSRVESPDVAPTIDNVYLLDLVDSQARLFEEVCRERRLRIVPEIGEGVRHIQSDRRLLELILKNLLDNSTKYAFEGTEIHVVAAAFQGDAGASPMLSLKVIDRGIGIPYPHQQRIFERFYQVDSARSAQTRRRGTGLGLAIVKHAVKRLGGSIGVESVWQQGTTMTVLVPASGAAVPSRVG